ncbi:MAG: hypothetical protein Kow0077_25270 [Anaerolineae bacterium]
MQQGRNSQVMDGLSLVFSVLVVGMAIIWLGRTGAFQVSLVSSENTVWYLIRSLGVMGYILLTVSVVWGLALSTRMARDWSPGVLSMLLHSTISWLSLVMATVHALLLLVDKYFSYQVLDILVPFRGPYRPLAVGLGTLAFWGLVIVTPSFMMKKRGLSHKVWKRLHYLTYATFGLVTVHALFAGTDARYLGFRLLLGAGVLTTVVLLGYRIGTARTAKTGQSTSRNTHAARSGNRRQNVAP